MRAFEQRFIPNAAALTAISLILSGCLMGEEEAAVQGETLADHELSGSVGDGPVVGAAMRILRNDGTELAQLESDANAGYNITVRTKGKYYPLSIDARNGTDLVTNTAPDFDLWGAVLEPGKKTVANVNPFSTFAVELARDLPGGVSKANLESAEDTVAREFNNGLTTLATSGTMGTKIGGANIAEIVRASEALGETVRRTRDAISSSGSPTTANTVVRALSSDLTDDVIDGLGGPRADARIAAVATVVAAQVLLETMANELHVNGADATEAMAGAIAQVTTDPVDPTLEDLTVTADMLERARIGLVAAHGVTGDTAIAEMLTALEGVQAGASSSTVSTFALPSDYRGRLDNAILLVAGGSNTVLNNVNTVSRNGTQTIGSENRAPTISGTPAASVEAGQAYSFTPTASDPDGDTLTYTVTNPPTWASFNNATGELSGTPASTDVGDHTAITITASDGELTSSVGPFSINVFVDNAPPVISGTPPSSVVVGEAYTFTPTASDPNDDTLTFDIINPPPWLGFDTATGTLSGTPATTDVGIHDAIEITVSDGSLTDTLGPFSIEVTSPAVNTPPTISGTPDPEVMVGNAYSFIPTADDLDGDPLMFSIVGQPSWANFNESTGEVSGTPQEEHVNTYSGITITVSDGTDSADLGPFTITVQAAAVGSVTLSWTAPTLNEDGTELTDLDGYWIYWGTEPGVYPNSERIDDETLTTWVIDNLLPGTYEFVATSFNTAGVQSAYSNPATKTVTTP